MFGKFVLALAIAGTALGAVAGAVHAHADPSDPGSGGPCLPGGYTGNGDSCKPGMENWDYIHRMYGPSAPSMNRPNVVSANDVENQISAKMVGANGQKADSVVCPQDLKADVGAQINCAMQMGSKTNTVNVTVSSVKGDQVKFDMVQTIDKAQVASQINDELARQFGSRPASVICPDDLNGTVGATLRC